MRRRSLLWGAGLLATGLVIWVGATAWQSRPADFSAMAAPDRGMVGELLWIVTGNPDTYEPGMTRAVQAVFEKYRHPTAVQRDALRETGHAIARLHRLFWQDALQAIAAGHPVRSGDRARLEQQLIAEGFLVSLRVQANTALMNTIAARQPIMTNHGVEMVMDDATITRVLASQDERETAAVIERLLALP